MGYLRILLCALLLPLAACASTQSNKAYYTDNGTFASLLTPPPAPHSTQWRKEVDSMVKLQKKPGKTALAKARAERDMSPEMMLPASVNRAHYPKTFALLDRVGKTSHDITRTAKKHWNTKRPYMLDKRIKTLINAHDNPAYPSGHTSGSYVWAHVLGMLLPEHRAAFIARAEEIAQHRVLVGMHYPHDLAGGKQLALLIVGGLQQNPAFNADMEAARRELKSNPPSL